MLSTIETSGWLRLPRRSSELSQGVLRQQFAMLAGAEGGEGSSVSPSLDSIALRMNVFSGSICLVLSGAIIPRWSWHHYSMTGRAVFASLITLGLVLGLWILRRWPRSHARIVRLGSWGTLLSLAIAHALVVWVLRLDPNRDQTGIPLPPPFNLLADFLLLLLTLVGPIIVGLAASQLSSSIRERKVDLSTVIAVLVALYVVWAEPWVGVVLWD